LVTTVVEKEIAGRRHKWEEAEIVAKSMRPSTEGSGYEAGGVERG